MPTKLTGNTPHDVLQYLNDVRDEFDDCVKALVAEPVKSLGRSVQNTLPALNAIVEEHGLPPITEETRDRGLNSFCEYATSIWREQDRIALARFILEDVIEMLTTFLETRVGDKPEWSEYKTPTEWRKLRADVGSPTSERTWTRKRKDHPDDIQGEPGTEGRSCRITRKLAEDWGLKLPEFE